MNEVPDKDRPSTWVKYREGMCHGCSGACCTMPVEIVIDDLQRLGLISEDERLGSPKKVFKKLQKAKIIKSYRSSSGLFMIEQRANGDCYFLDRYTRLCTVYEQRPGVCREFPKIGPRPGFCPVGPKSSAI